MRNADMFTVDVFEKLNKLNMTLQKKKIVWTWNVEVFKTKVSLFAKQANEGNFCHFFLLGKQKVLAKCLKVFLLRLRIICRIWRSQEDFRTSRKLNLLFYSITADIDATFKFVLIDIQSNHTMKEMLWLLQVFVY